jgi:hypothetical protein
VTIKLLKIFLMHRRWVRFENRIYDSPRRPTSWLTAARESLTGTSQLKTCLRCNIASRRVLRILRASYKIPTVSPGDQSHTAQPSSSRGCHVQALCALTPHVLSCVCLWHGEIVSSPPATFFLPSFPLIPNVLGTFFMIKRER